MNRVIISFAKGAWYPKGQQRLKESIEKFNPDVDFIGINSEETVGSPPHLDVPYAFKIFCLLYCKDLGYDTVIYADASIFAVKTWQPIWDIVDEQGYYFEEAGHMVGTWTKDSVLEKYGLTRDEAMEIPMHSAGFTALNYKNIKALNFLQMWHDASIDGDSFIGSWTNRNNEVSKDPRCKGHRHDMSVASILANRLKMIYGKGGTYLSYIGKSYGIPSQTSCAYLVPPC